MSSFNTVEEVDEFIEKFIELRNLIAPIATRLAKLRGYRWSIDPEECYIDDSGYICFDWEEQLRCNNYEKHTVRVPTEYLFDDTYLVKEEEALRLEQERKKKQEETMALIRKQKEKEARRQAYIKLHREFGK